MAVCHCVPQSLIVAGGGHRFGGGAQAGIGGTAGVQGPPLRPTNPKARFGSNFFGEGLENPFAFPVNPIVEHRAKLLAKQFPHVLFVSIPHLIFKIFQLILAWIFILACLIVFFLY